jgi:hypothetical protein
MDTSGDWMSTSRRIAIVFGLMTRLLLGALFRAAPEVRGTEARAVP